MFSLKQLRGPERLFRTGQWLVALLFAYFLIQVGAHLIADVPLASHTPEIEDFRDPATEANIQASLKPLQNELAALDKSSMALEERLQQLRDDYERDKVSFNNWRATRSDTQSSDQNPEVISRARQLDAQLDRQRAVEVEIQALTQRRQQVSARMQPYTTELQKQEAEADSALQNALHNHDLKNFGIRLLLVAPLLLLALWLFRRKRRSDHWPFVWGFIFFALFAFFFELVPYLPSFGGYIRYGVGALLTFLGGRALIKALRAYLERKQREQEAPAQTRQQDIRYEKALDALARSQCPSCERGLPEQPAGEVNFCMHCGLKLYRRCTSCGQRHNAFYPFCPTCGEPAPLEWDQNI